MMYLVSFYDKDMTEFVPVGIYDDQKLAEKHIQAHPGIRWNIVDFKLNKFDQETFDNYH